MSQFEYISVAVSLVLTFSVARLLSGVPYLFLGERGYWVHTLWCTLATVNFATFWWFFWNYHVVQTWTLGSFLMVLSYPAICYVSTVILMPADASSGTDWRAYFFRVRRGIFLVFGISVVMLGAITILVLGAPLLAPPLYLSALFASIYLVGFLSANPRIHGALVVINALAVVGIYGPLINHPILE